MKFILMLLVSFCSLSAIAQTNDHIVFEYDGAGNQIKRYVVDIDPGKDSNGHPKEIDELNEEDLLVSDIYNDVKYYPNPVHSELYVQWENSFNLKVTTIEVHNINGQKVKQYASPESNNIQIQFGDYPQGLYTVALFYSDGNKKTLKILKH